MTAANTNYDEILSTTLANYRSKFEDNIFSARPLAHFLKQAGQIRIISGGEKIVEQIINGLNTTAASYSGYDPLDTTPQEGLTAAQYDWKQFSVSITISGIEEAKNSGPEQIIDLLGAKTMQAEETAIEKFDEMWFGDGTGNGGKDWLGLSKLVAQNTTSVGNIDPSVYTFWQSATDTTSEVLTLSDLGHVYNSAAEGNDRPTIGLTTQTLYEKYESLLQPALRYQDTRTADAGFHNLLFKGAPVTYDTYCTSGSWYFLNPKYLKLVGHKDVWSKTTPFVKPATGDFKVAQILWYGNLTISNRNRQGVLTNKTA
jgi:hypothetical protein